MINLKLKKARLRRNHSNQDKLKKSDILKNLGDAATSVQGYYVCSFDL